MRLTLNQQDIKKALIAHVATLGLNLDGRSVDVELTAGRGANGHSAVVIIDEDTSETIGNCEVAAKPTTVTATAKVESAPVAAEAKVEAQTDETVEIPKVTPETEGHESTKKSLFD